MLINEIYVILGKAKKLNYDESVLSAFENLDEYDLGDILNNMERAFLETQKENLTKFQEDYKLINYDAGSDCICGCLDALIAKTGEIEIDLGLLGINESNSEEEDVTPTM